MSHPRITFSFDRAFGKARKPVSLFLVLCSSSILTSQNWNAVACRFCFLWVFFPQETWSNRILSGQGLRARQQDSPCSKPKNDWKNSHCWTWASYWTDSCLGYADNTPWGCSEFLGFGLVLFSWLLLKKLSFPWYSKGMCCDLSLARCIWCEIWVWPWKSTLQERVYFALCWR